MKKTEKSVDCVEMKRAASLRIHESLKDMTEAERSAYWERKNEEMRQRYPRMRRPKDSEGSGR